MLVITRKIGEKMQIGQDISVTVLDVHHGRVRLGFSGPREVPIYREEIHRRMQAETREAAGVAER